MKNQLNFLILPVALLAIVGFHRSSSCCAGGGPAMGVSGTKPFPAKQSKAKQTATVTIDNGYSPSTILVKKGKPVELTFVGGKNIGCGGTVVFESLKVSRDVATGKSVVIRFTPTKTGEIPFTCGMGMLRGTVIVK